MRQVICDTNIWYNIGSGTIIPPKNIELIATWANVIELAYSHPKNKIDFNITLWKEAADAILNHSSAIIDLDPFEFAVNRVFPTYSNFSKRDLRSILKVISKSTNPLADSVYLTNQKHFDSFLTTKDEFVTKMIKFKNDVRGEFLKSQILKESFKKNQKDYYKTRAADVLFDIDTYLSLKNEAVVFDNENDMDQSLNKVEKEFNFYITVKQRFLHNLTLVKSMSVQPNDFIDLTSLMYVDDRKNYWTLEKRWLTLIDEAGQADKLY